MPAPVRLTYNNGAGLIEFNDNIEWLERYLTQRTAQSTRRTVGGSHITYYSERTSGLPLTLRASEDRGVGSLLRLRHITLSR